MLTINQQQNEFNFSQEPISAQLARRLGEAADGFRDGQYHYFLTKPEFPFDLISAQGSYNVEEALHNARTLLSEKNRAIEGAESQFILAGPFKTTVESGLAIDFDHIELRYIKGEVAVGEVLTIQKDEDAIVFNLSAFDKFFLPYYARLYSAEQAADLRQKVAIDLSNGKVCRHGGATYPTTTGFKQ